MIKGIKKGHCLARGTEVCVVNDMDFHMKDCKVYKIGLVSTRDFNVFGDYVYSDEWDLLIKAMEDDLNKTEQFNFVHPKCGKKGYLRHYMGRPVNGNAFLMVDQEDKPEKVAYVKVILNSYYLKTRYLFLEDYPDLFNNPDTMAEMVKRAFNHVLKGLDVEVILEPWDVDAFEPYILDSWCSYKHGYKKSAKQHRSKLGFEDALEASKKKMEPKPKKKYKSDRVEDYIAKGDSALILELLHKAIKNKISPNEIARPVRYLCDEGFFLDGDERRLPYNAFIAEFPEVNGMISRSSYNDYVDPNKKGYTRGARTKELEKLFIPIL